ncbi:ankyrin repeat domain-containing protein [Bordetella muralis]|uniref:ankyrin repeat domain-containing protein n=1 Tax=Bordetella muralis TaxID=1649130 RepID=UPI0039F04F4A
MILGDGGARHVQIVQALVQAGADVNLPDGPGVTPLAHARQHGYDDIARILMDAGAKP